MNKRAVECSKILGARSFLWEKHLILVIEDCTDFVWSYFLKEKSELKKCDVGHN